MHDKSGWFGLNIENWFKDLWVRSFHEWLGMMSGCLFPFRSKVCNSSAENADIKAMFTTFWAQHKDMYRQELGPGSKNVKASWWRHSSWYTLYLLQIQCFDFTDFLLWTLVDFVSYNRFAYQNSYSHSTTTHQHPPLTPPTTPPLYTLQPTNPNLIETQQMVFPAWNPWHWSQNPPGAKVEKLQHRKRMPWFTPPEN